MRVNFLAGVCAFGCITASPAFCQVLKPIAAAAATGPTEDLSSLSIEQLANIEVRSASKRGQPLSEAPPPSALLTMSRSSVLAR